MHLEGSVHFNNTSDFFLYLREENDVQGSQTTRKHTQPENIQRAESPQ